MSKGLTDAKRRAIARYNAKNTRQIALKLNLNTDKDILARLERERGTKTGFQGYIKRLIRADIKGGE